MDARASRNSFIALRVSTTSERLLGDHPVVEARVTGEDKYAVGCGERLRRRLDRRQLEAVERELWREGIRIADLGAPAGEHLDDLERG